MNKWVRWTFLLAWIALLGAFTYRQATVRSMPPGLLAASAALAEGGDQEWFGLYMSAPGGERQKIGYAAIRRKRTESGFRTEANTYMRMAIQGTEQIMRTDSQFVTDADHRLRYVDFSMLSDKMKFRITGRVRDGAINLEMETSGGMQQQTIPMPEVPVMPDDISAYLADRGGLKVGTKVELPYFDPMTRRYDRAEIRVVDRMVNETPEGTIVSYRIMTKMSGIDAETIVDEKGEVLQERTAGISMVREPRQTALTENWLDKPVDLPDLARVTADRPIADSKDTTFLKVRLKGVDLTGLELDDARQTLEGDVLTVRVGKAPAKGTYNIPYKGDDPELIRLTKPEPLIESDDPQLVNQAKQIVPVSVDAMSAAWALEEWVYKGLEKRPLVSMTSAKEVWLVRRGDCNEHASLYTALARALGIPTRVNVGLVYAGGSFYYHAWNSVWVGEWVAVDPTWDEIPADATHLRIVSGGLDKQVDLVRMMGKLSIDVLEAR